MVSGLEVYGISLAKNGKNSTSLCLSYFNVQFCTKHRKITTPFQIYNSLGNMEKNHHTLPDLQFSGKRGKKNHFIISDSKVLLCTKHYKIAICFQI